MVTLAPFAALAVLDAVSRRKDKFSWTLQLPSPSECRQKSRS